MANANARLKGDDGTKLREDIIIDGVITHLANPEQAGKLKTLIDNGDVQFRQPDGSYSSKITEASIGRVMIRIDDKERYFEVLTRIDGDVLRDGTGKTLKDKDGKDIKTTTGL